MSVTKKNRPYQTLIEAVHPDDANILNDSVEHLSTHGFSASTYRIIHPDGNIIWIRERTKLVLDETGTPDRVDKIVTDITEYKKVELAWPSSPSKYWPMGGPCPAAGTSTPTVTP